MRSLFSSLPALLVVASLSIGCATADKDHLTLRFFADTYEEDASWNDVHGSVVWLNNEPIGYVKRGSSLDVVGFPVKKGENKYQLDRGGALQVAKLTKQGPSFLSVKEGTFIVQVVDDHLPVFNGKRAFGVNTDQIKADVRRLLDAMTRGNPREVNQLFKGDPDTFTNGLQRGMLAKREWASVYTASVDEMRVSIGDYFIVIHPGEDRNTLLLLDGGRVSFDVRYVLLFVNEANEIAIYNPTLAPDYGFVFKEAN